MKHATLATRVASMLVVTRNNRKSLKGLTVLTLNIAITKAVKFKRYASCKFLSRKATTGDSLGRAAPS